MPRGGTRQHLGPEDMAVGHDDAEVGLEPAQAGGEDVADRALGLQDGMPAACGGGLDGRRDQGGAGAALRPVGLGHHADDLVPLPEQRPERRHRELRRAEEDDPHHSGRAGAGCTSLM